MSVSITAPEKNLPAKFLTAFADAVPASRQSQNKAQNSEFKTSNL